MTVVHETDVDGVRCFWVDTGRPTLAATLMFRQGQVDEPLTESGWLHLLEHLALHGTGKGTLSINGSVSLLFTTFDAHGPAEMVSKHFSDVTRWLGEPVLDGLDKERDVLMAEAAMRGGPVTRALAWRYGARGPGVTNYDDVGLSRATPAALLERARTAFTRENAVLVLDGPPPAELSLGLSTGRTTPPPPAVPCEDVLPAQYVDNAGLILSGVVARSSGATLIPAVVERMLRSRLRDETGGAYAPWAMYEPVDADQAVVLAGSDVGPKLLPVLAKEALQIVRRIEDDGLPQEYLSESVDATVQVITDPYNAFGLAYRAGRHVLDGDDPETLDQIVESMRAVDAAALQSDAVAFTETLLMGVPEDAAAFGELPRLEAPSHAPRADGRRFRHADWPAVPDELRVSEASVQLSSGTYARSVSYADIEAMMAFEDGGRHFITRDGWGLEVNPSAWRDGREAVQLVDQRVHADRTLALPMPQTEPPPPLSAMRRWSGGALRAASTWVGIVIIAVVIGGAAVGAALLIPGGGLGFLPLAAGFLIAGLVRGKRSVGPDG